MNSTLDQVRAAIRGAGPITFSPLIVHSPTAKADEREQDEQLKSLPENEVYFRG